MEPMKPVDWCFKMLESAIADFDIASVKDYTELLKLWVGRGN